MSKQQPSQGILAEQAVLGGLILDASHFDAVIEQLDTPDFVIYPHQIIFEAIKKLISTSQSADLITLSEYLTETQLKEVGGFAYLAELSKNTPSVINVPAYSNIVKEHAQKRTLQQLLQQVLKKIDSESFSYSAETLECYLLELVDKKVAAHRKISEVVDSVIYSLENDTQGILTGIVQLDELTHGYQPSDLIVISGRPSMGKTAFALGNILNALTLNPKQPVIFFSLEMSSEKIIERALAMMGQFSIHELKKTGSEICWGQFARAMGQLLNFDDTLIIDDDSYLTPVLMRSRIKRYLRQYGQPQLIVVDYIQLMRSDLKENRNIEVSELSRSLKAMAKEFQVPVIALSQLNRKLEDRADKRPNNGDLRDSGSIEQDADLIIHLYRDEVYRKDDPTNQGKVELIIGKHRNGPIGTVMAQYIAEHTRFTEAAPEVGGSDEYYGLN